MSAPSRPFSWPLALGLIAIGIAAASVRQLWVYDYDEAGFVRSADGLRLAWESQGRGRPLVALAGGPGVSHHGFHPNLGLLSRVARVIYFDPRGRGTSDAAQSYRAADDVADVEALRAGLGLDRLDLLGVSYGAHLAAAYALEHPRAVRALVLVSPIVGEAAWRSHLEALAAAPGMSQMLRRVRRERGEVRLSDRASMAPLIEALLPLYWCDVRAARRAGSVFRPRHHLPRQNLHVYEDLVGQPFPGLNGDLAQSPLDHRLGELRAPVLIVQGACDRAVPAAPVRSLERALPAARRVVLLQSGHAPFIEQPRRFAEEVSAFLRSMKPAGVR
jgi:proline iminopeptidase